MRTPEIPATTIRPNSCAGVPRRLEGANNRRSKGTRSRYAVQSCANQEVQLREVRNAASWQSWLVASASAVSAARPPLSAARDEGLLIALFCFLLTESRTEGYSCLLPFSKASHPLSSYKSQVSPMDMLIAIFHRYSQQIQQQQQQQHP